MCCIKLQDVSFSYGSGLVLDRLNFSVDSGRFVVIVGPNGAGKSTLLKLIAGLLKPLEGQIFINGHSIGHARKQGLLAYVPQYYSNNAADFPATVREIVAMGLVPRSGKTLKPAAAEHIVDHMLELVDAKFLKEKRIGELSGGQQQRVMVARALAGNPQLLILDEPTSGIDYDASIRIFELLSHLHSTLGLTVLMVSHDVERAAEQATEVACINRGLCYYGLSSEFLEKHVQSRHLLYFGG